MHYTDKAHLKKNILKIVVYVHGTSSTNKVEYDITSIHKCKYISPRLLKILLENSHKNLKPFLEDLNLIEEEFYLLSFKQIGWDELSLIDHENVSEKKNEFYQLH